MVTELSYNIVEVGEEFGPLEHTLDSSAMDPGRRADEKRGAYPLSAGGAQPLAYLFTQKATPAPLASSSMSLNLSIYLNGNLV